MNINQLYFEEIFSRTDQTTDEAFSKAQQDAMALVSKYFSHLQGPYDGCDLGCGPGAFSSAFLSLGHNVTAIDYSDAILETAQVRLKGNKLTFLKMDISDLSGMDSNSFNIINCTGDTVLYLDSLDSLRRRISNSYRLLKSNGSIFLEFRDFSKPLPLENRIIVKKINRGIKIITLFYGPEKITTIDTYLDQDGQIMNQEKSEKIIISEEGIKEIFKNARLSLGAINVYNGKVEILGKKF